MRLTLRTLLAWMDDTLQPDEVREIGRQVGDSPFARDLRDRIKRVTRQRRLAVPSSSGQDATDPNVVAAYLDNDLDPDGVAEFEKLCLTSDVNLAEVASVHQILSLLGQKVKVPAEARSRMYQLVRGRESSAARRKPASRRPVKEPVTAPIQPWSMPELPRRPWIERYGPAMACVFLILVATWAARESLHAPPAGNGGGTAGGTASVAQTPAPIAPAQPVPADAEAAKLAAAGSPAIPEPTPAEPPAPPAPSPPTPSTEKKNTMAAAEKGKAAPTPTVPEGVAALAEKSDGVLLRYNEDRREWDRLENETPLKTSDRILCLEPFRASIIVGKIRIALIRQTEVRILSNASDSVPAIELVDGKIAVREPAGTALKVVFGKQAVNVEIGSDSEFGMERFSFKNPGEPVSLPSALGVLCQQGEVSLVMGSRKETLKPMTAALVEASGAIQTKSQPSLPSWIAQAEPTATENELKDQFVKMFHPGRPVLAEVVAAIEDERPVIRPLAVAALQALGDLSLLMPTLSRPNDRSVRRSAINAIYSYMMQGPEASARVRAALDQEFGTEMGGFAHHMLIGFTQDEAGKPELYKKLVSLLSPEQESLGLRELAIGTLKQLSGRDDLGYDPDKPEGKGLDAWNDLLQNDELPPPALRPARPAGRSKGQK